MGNTLNNNIKWYENNINSYFKDTVYDTDKLVVELSEDKWFKINPTRGIRRGICCFDLINDDSAIADFLINVYGETEYDRMIIDKKELRFSRRKVAAGGALYPNVIYLLIKNDGMVNVYQFDPALSLLHFISSTKAKNDMLKEDTCYFLATVFYWRNWLKYRYFGYRLMNVDTGYLIGNFYSEAEKCGYEGSIHISDEMFRTVSGYIDIDSSREGMCFIAEIGGCLAGSVSKLKNRISYSVYDDWDTEAIPLYKKIETAALSQSFDLTEKFAHNSLAEHIFRSENTAKNRVSPGGAAMQCIRPMKKQLLTDTLSDLSAILSKIEELDKDVSVYVVITKTEDMKRGLYRYVPENEDRLEFIRSIDESLQPILKKHNFNLDDTPVLFFAGCTSDHSFDSCTESEFKIIQQKIGFVSHMITIAAAANNCYTHPILGFDVRLAEKMLGEKYLLNLITFSEKKTLDRMKVEYSR